ncbi:MAG: DUF4403 family protein [Erythrobacter sp.]|nr:DUF4403 family protein [Erythrobacter sp.]
MALLAACNSGVDYPAPDRDETEPDIPSSTSRISTSVRIPLSTLRAEVEKAADKRLWQIDETRENCLPPQRIHALGRDIRVSPDVSCRIQGHLDRGRVSLAGRGQDLEVRIPVAGRLAVRDIGGIIKQETVDAAAEVVVRVRFSVSPDWQLRPTARLSYNWKRRPGLDILGRNIDLTGHAEDRLSRIKPGIERQIERELAKIDLRSLVEPAWQSGFTVLSVNRENPPVWLLLRPETLALDRYAASDRELTLHMVVEGAVESFVGARPDEPASLPLPALGKDGGDGGLTLTVPVLADYAQVEPPLERTLDNLEAEPIKVRGIGEVDANFGDVELYPTTDGQIAVGVDVEAKPRGGWLSWLTSGAKGKVWLVGQLESEPGSEVIEISGLEVYGKADELAGDLLVSILRTARVREAIERELKANLTQDYERIDAKVREALQEVRTGDWVLSAQIDTLDHGGVTTTNAGLYLPVTAKGSASLRYQPR